LELARVKEGLPYRVVVEIFAGRVVGPHNEDARHAAQSMEVVVAVVEPTGKSVSFARYGESPHDNERGNEKKKKGGGGNKNSRAGVVGLEGDDSSCFRGYVQGVATRRVGHSVFRGGEGDDVGNLHRRMAAAVSFLGVKQN
jgi:hypothetical protein